MAALPSVTDLLALDVPQRLELIRVLWNSIVDTGVEPQLSPAERSLLDARLEAHARDPEAGSTWAEVEARLRR